MSVDVYQRLLEELAEAFNLETKGRELGATPSCAVTMDNATQIQVEIANDQEHVLLATEIGEVPPGRFRQDFFKAALISNGKGQNKNGVLSYTDEPEQLFLFKYVPLERLTGAELATIIIPFSQKATIWKEALESGNIPQVTADQNSAGPGTMFGIR